MASPASLLRRRRRETYCVGNRSGATLLPGLLLVLPRGRENDNMGGKSRPRARGCHAGLVRLHCIFTPHGMA